MKKAKLVLVLVLGLALYAAATVGSASGPERLDTERGSATVGLRSAGAAGRRPTPGASSARGHHP